MNLGLLHRLPESALSRGKLSARLMIRLNVIVERIFDDRIEVQAGQSPQLVLAEAMLTQAPDDAAHLRSGCQGSISGPQRAGPRWRLSARDDVSLVTHLEAPVHVFEDLHLHARVARTLRAGQQLEGAPLVLDRVIAVHLISDNYFCRSHCLSRSVT